MEKSEVLIEWVRFLRDKQKTYESILKEAIVIFVTTPLVSKLITQLKPALTAITMAFIIITLYAVYNVYRLNNEISKVWEQLLKDPLDHFEPLPFAALVLGLLAIVLILLG